MARRTLSVESKETLGANLLAKRESSRLSQGEAARRARVNREMLSRWENGKIAPDIDSLLRMAVAYSCAIDDLVGGVDEEYDEIIERRIPIDVKQHYRARNDTFIRRTTAALQLALEPGAPAPAPTAPAAATRKAAGTSAAARARRPRKKS